MKWTEPSWPRASAPARNVSTGLPAIAASISALVFRATTASASASSWESAVGSIFACGSTTSTPSGAVQPAQASCGRRMRAQDDAGVAQQGSSDARTAASQRSKIGARAGATFGDEPR